MLTDTDVAALNDQACANNLGRQGEWDELNEDGKAWARELARLAYERGLAARSDQPAPTETAWAVRVLAYLAGDDGSVYPPTEAAALTMATELFPRMPEWAQRAIGDRPTPLTTLEEAWDEGFEEGEGARRENPYRKAEPQGAPQKPEGG